MLKEFTKISNPLDQVSLDDDEGLGEELDAITDQFDAQPPVQVKYFLMSYFEIENET